VSDCGNDRPDELAAEVLAEIRRIAARELGEEPPIELGQALADHPELDSVGRIVLAVGLEDRFRVKLPDSEGLEITTVDELVELVVREVRGRRPAGETPS
jgi:acyl carrier protein